MEDRRFIVIEGPLGSGKTTLAKILAPRFNAKMVLDQPNPFGVAFFKDMERHAFPAQVFDLLNRYQQQQREVMQVDLFERGVVCDYLFSSEHLFAELNLSEEEFLLYEKLLRAMDLKAPIPDLLIFLQTDADTLYERLQRSGYDYGRWVPTTICKL